MNVNRFDFNDFNARREERERERKNERFDSFRATLLKLLRNKNYAGNDKGILVDREVHLRIRPLNRQ